MNGIFEKVRIMLMQNSQENINYQTCCWEIADNVGKVFWIQENICPKTELIFVTTVGNRIFFPGTIIFSKNNAKFYVISLIFLGNNAKYNVICVVIFM